jgi:hypothetical protein
VLLIAHCHVISTSNDSSFLTNKALFRLPGIHLTPKYYINNSMLNDNTALTGPLASEWGNLSKLTLLDLSNDVGLTGTVPIEVQSLTKLKLVTDDSGLTVN